MNCKNASDAFVYSRPRMISTMMDFAPNNATQQSHTTQPKESV